MLSPSLLSDRERQVIVQAARGLTDKEIAVQLGVSPATVRTYWDRIREKVGALSRTHAVALCHFLFSGCGDQPCVAAGKSVTTGRLMES